MCIKIETDFQAPTQTVSFPSGSLNLQNVAPWFYKLFFPSSFIPFNCIMRPKIFFSPKFWSLNIKPSLNCDVSVSSNYCLHVYLTRLWNTLLIVSLDIPVDRDSSVGISTRYGAGRSWYRIPVWWRDFPHPSRPSPWGPTHSGNRVFFVGVKRPWRGADHPPHSIFSAEVKGRVELYICYLSGSSWHVVGWRLPLLLSLGISLRQLCTVLTPALLSVFAVWVIFAVDSFIS
jgi:hypothetical protein